MNNTCRMACAYFDSVGFKYHVMDDEKSRLLVSYSMDDAPSLEILVAFDDNDRTVALRAYNFVKKIDDDKCGAFLIGCNELNSKFRWVKFYLDTEDNSITLENDAVVSADTAGEEIRELTARMAGIADDAYPILMKIKYGGK